jgi:hypothetical protein
MDNEALKVLATSAVVSAMVGGLVTFLSQNWLLKRKAQLDYELEAKKRLYEAVGPLRLQLLLAARDVVRRFKMHHKDAWDMSPDGYYVKSCVYRLLAPLAIGQLIERRMSVVDFTVDNDAVGLLSFVTSAERMLTGNDVVLDHPDLDWSSQSQHVFRDNLRAAAYKLVVSKSGESDRLMTFAEFDATYELLDTEALKDLATIFKNCESSLTENSIFWIRVTGYAYACAEHLKSRPAVALGFEARELPIEEMVRATNDQHFISRLDLYKERLRLTVSEGF